MSPALHHPGRMVQPQVPGPDSGLVLLPGVPAAVDPLDLGRHLGFVVEPALREPTSAGLPGEGGGARFKACGWSQRL